MDGLSILVTLAVGALFGAVLVGTIVQGQLQRERIHVAVLRAVLETAHRRFDEELLKGDAALREEVKKFLLVFKRLS